MKKGTLWRPFLVEIKVNPNISSKAANLKESQDKLENHDTSGKCAKTKVIIKRWGLRGISVKEVGKK